MKRLFTLVLLIGSTALAAIGAETAAPSATAAGDPRLKVFAAQKRQQTEELAAQLHLQVPPEVRLFFQAAEQGDGNAVSNSFARIQQLTGQPASSLVMPGYPNVLTVTIHETRDTYSQFGHWDGTMLQKFADGILGSIPSGSVYFGGTDPGRFVITAVRDVAQSPDIFVLTQNGLADNRYMDYLRLMDGKRLSLPAETDVKAAFQEYLRVVQDRRKRGQPVGAGEQVQVDSRGRVSVRGIEGVMAVNGILTKWIFDRNKAQHEFYIEESSVIPWMDPYLEPHGLIMKLNREPMKKLDPAVVAQDRKFWDMLTRELLADPHFRDNDAARLTFSKLRSAIGGLYTRRQLASESESAYRQAVDLCPTSPTISFRLVQLYIGQNRFDDAIAVMEQLQSRFSGSAADRRGIVEAIAHLREAKRQARNKQQKPIPSTP